VIWTPVIFKLKLRMDPANDTFGSFKLGLLGSVLLLCLHLSCSLIPSPDKPRDDLSWAAAETLYVQAERNMAEGKFVEAGIEAKKIIFGYPGFYRADEVFFLASQAALSLGKIDEAARYSIAVVDSFPTSPKREEALLLASRCLIELKNYRQSADVLLKIFFEPSSPEARSKAEETLRELMRLHLRPSDLEELAQKYPASPLAEEMALTIAKKEFARGNHERAYEILGELLYHFPEGEHSLEARRLLKLSATPRKDADIRREHVDPTKIGAIFPMTGPYSIHGRYFEQGLSLAVDEYNQTSDFQISLVTADSRGAPVDAVNAVRKLTVEEGVIAIIGSIFTVPTIAASIEANAWQIALLSPLVSLDRIAEIGPWIFQTKVPQKVEVTAVARAAKNDLLLKRFAVLSPDSGERRDLGAFFAAEIRRLGGEVVATEHYEDGSTNFKDQLDLIREAAPEALFIPGSTEDLILILPQINFYDMHARLLGLSNWNSERLIRLARQEIEDALFPLDVYHGEEKEAYDKLAAAYQQRFGGELSSVAIAGYFGIKLILQGISQGAADREQLGEFLQSQLHEDAMERMAEANALSIMTVRSGKIERYTPLSK
jgi:branched-chain amino acid transport system substrate-binding protein